jgi:hypothetical protein
MKAIDIQKIFENKLGTLDLLSGNNAKPFTSSEIEMFLNDALAQKYHVLINDYEINELSKRALDRYVHRYSFSSPESNDLPPQIVKNSVFYKVPQNVSNDGVIVEESALVGKDDVRVQVKPVKHDYFWANIHNKYKKPYKKLVWRLNVSNINDEVFHELVYDPLYAPTVYQFTYIEGVPEISFDLNNEIKLPDKDIYDIVDLAVQHAALRLGSTSGKPDKNV